MKLIQEYSLKIILFVFALSILLEIGISILTILVSKNIFSNVNTNIIQNSELKSIHLIEIVKNITDYLLTKYNNDLKIMAKHALLLVGKQNYNSSLVINKNSRIFKNSDEQKVILPANLDDLLKIDYIKKFYNNDSAKNFDYFSKYEEEFNNSKDYNLILRSLFSNNSHQELNAISYYNPYKNESEYSLIIKYMMSILKTILIKRYISKRENMDYFHFLILYKYDIYIYPPKPLNEINVFFYNIIYPSFCNYSSENENMHFPYCAYNYIAKESIKYRNYFSITYKKINFENVFMTVCIKFPFIEKDPDPGTICIEIDFAKVLNSKNFSKTQKYEFGLIFKEQDDLFPITINNYLLNDMKNIFNDTVPDKFILNKTKAPMFSLFHFLYYNLTKVAKEHPELKINFTEIAEEYNIIKNQIYQELDEHDKNKNKPHFIKVPFIKTVCQKSLLSNYFECFKDTFEFILYPIYLEVSPLNEDFIEITFLRQTINSNIISFSIISINPYYNNNLISTILRIKIERTIILFFFLTVIIMSLFIILISFLSEISLNPINKIIGELKQINIINNSKKFSIFKQDKISGFNKEMLQLKNIFEIMRKSLIIKQVFEKEYFLEKHNLEFYNLVQDIDKRNIKEICNSYLGFYHFKNNSFNLAENEFNSTISFIIDNLNEATSGNNSDYEDKIKDSIKRSSTSSYINEFSKFEKIEENLLTIINLNIFKQRFMYLYAMTKFKLGSEINNINIGQNTAIAKNKSKKDNEKRKNYFKEAIKYFIECKNINIMLGINQIKNIYCLIMISKCYIQLNEYSNSINNINEALSLFFEFSKSFKDSHSKNYNSKIMLFIENNIFHYILYTFEHICYSFNKPFACNWIILKIFETSPFFINNIHYHSGIFLQTFLERNKLKLNKADSKFLTNTVLLKEYEKIKKNVAKIVSRTNAKNINSKIIKKKVGKSMGDSSYSASYQKKTDSKNDKSIFSSTFKREMITSKMTTSFHNKDKNMNKIITLCLSEKILEKVNGIELKDAIIKYFQKYFILNENDKFSFIQFANNGKKTVNFKMEKLDYFLLKMQKTKNTFELTDSFIPNRSSPFMELYNIFDSIIKNYPPVEEALTDNIIIMFINSDDIRFTSVHECLNIVQELNKKNISVFLLSYDNEIKKDKINNIQSFLEGLFEGYFFQIKSFQQLKQIFINLSVIDYQSNFFGYDFNSLENMI